MTATSGGITYNETVTLATTQSAINVSQAVNLVNGTTVSFWRSNPTVTGNLLMVYTNPTKSKPRPPSPPSHPPSQSKYKLHFV